MSTNTAQSNKAIVLRALDTLFNRRDYTAAAEFWSPDYLQHSAHIGPGRDGLFDLVRSLPPSSRWEHGPVVAEGDYVMVHSRYSGSGAPRALIAIDIVRLENGRLVEHWDVWENEAAASESRSGLPMFGAAFPD
ncbi:hypothetical protein D0B54_13230 [Solimonas sp. K1W22B-7]|uniref:nuclear transport factor 2 family protein n=1 Tax=Solimonas sp. K1W22B-7 TaxID=2303331 RepID=UPI000E337E3E|nr:nuclear transport factor 2 family protein [Solimonas sp. K1W22B-7]AXQ29593.1 hypothetical protein D0B54_13230 [Solimonas sp. K1W22B-7]